jgi:hypothetical protein
MSGWLGRYRVADDPLRTERRVELLVLVLLVLLVMQLVYASARLATLAPPAPVAPAVGSLDVAAVGERGDVSAAESELMKSRPLFWRSRRPSETPDVAAPVAKAAPSKSGNIDKVKLKGVFGSGASAGIIALVDGKQRRIRVGDVVEGWTLVAVKRDRGVFDNAGRKWEMVLKREAVPAKVAASETRMTEE